MKKSFLSCKCIFFSFYFKFKERGLQVLILRKSRTRQLTYASGAEPQHGGLGQHLYNSQSSIRSRQNGDELRLVQTFDQRLIATCPSILRPYSHSGERPSGRGLIHHNITFKYPFPGPIPQLRRPSVLSQSHFFVRSPCPSPASVRSTPYLEEGEPLAQGPRALTTHRTQGIAFSMLFIQGSGKT